MTEAKAITAAEAPGRKISAYRALRPWVTPSDDSGRQKYVHSVPWAWQRIRSQTEDYNPEGSLSDDAEGPLPGSVIFSPVLCLLRTKNIKQVRGTFLERFRGKTDQHVHSESGWPWRLGRQSYHQRSASIGIPGKEVFVFICNMDILYLWSIRPFLE